LERHSPGREVTRSLIAEIAGGELGAKLRSQVAASHPEATRDEVDECFQEACRIALLDAYLEGLRAAARA
jgi:hypothetical protein